MNWSVSKGLSVLVCGLALLGLAACGGGGGGDKKPEARIVPKADRHGAYSIGVGYGGGFAVRDSALSAVEAANASCEAVDTGCLFVLSFRNACGAVARSADNNRAGVGWDSSREDAQTKAIAACHASGGQNCRIATGTSGSPLSWCYTGGPSSATGIALPIFRRLTAGADRYGVYAMGDGGGGSFGAGDSRASARDNAVARCRGIVDDINCREVLWFRNACGAVAHSADRSRSGVGWGSSREDAQTKAIAACHASGGQNCRVATSSTGGTLSACYTGGSSPADGEAIPIDPRPSRGGAPSPSPTRDAPSPSPTREQIGGWAAVAISRGRAGYDTFATGLSDVSTRLSTPPRQIQALEPPPFLPGFISESRAREAALEACQALAGGTCSVGDRVFRHSCYAVAFGGGHTVVHAGTRDIIGFRTFAVETGQSLTDVRTEALSQCSGNGGADCTLGGAGTYSIPGSNRLFAVNPESHDFPSGCVESYYRVVE